MFNDGLMHNWYSSFLKSSIVGVSLALLQSPLGALSLHFFAKTMDRINDTLELLNILIHSTVDGMVKIRIDTLSDIKICLQNAHEKIDFLQLESQFQQEELHQNRHHSKPISVQNIETATHHQQVNIVEVHSDFVPNEAVVHADAEIQSALPKSIIRPWEELVHNKHRTGLGYDK